MRVILMDFRIGPDVRGVEDIIIAPVAVSMSLLHDSPDRALHKMKEGVNDLPVEIPGLLNILDEIAKVHVTISGALCIFDV